MMANKKILIIQTAFIGDAILSTSMLESLHKMNAHFSIDLLVRKGNEGLFANHPYLNELLVFDKSSKKYKNLFALLKTIRANNYDVVFNAQRFFTTGLITALSKAKVTIGFQKNPLSFLFTKRVPHLIGVGEFVHEIDRNHQLIKAFYTAPPAKPKLYPSEAQFKKVAPLQQHAYVLIAPASVWFTKQFPKEKWCELIALLPDSLTVYLIGGPGDRACAEAIQSQFENKKVVNLTGELSLLESAALMKGAVMNFVNDSGPLHLCSAMNAPVKAVFCGTVQDFGFGPLSDNAEVIEVQEHLPCRPCGLHGRTSCPEGHFKCAMAIDLKPVVEQM